MPARSTLVPRLVLAALLVGMGAFTAWLAWQELTTSAVVAGIMTLGLAWLAVSMWRRRRDVWVAFAPPPGAVYRPAPLPARTALGAEPPPPLRGRQCAHLLHVQVGPRWLLGVVADDAWYLLAGLRTDVAPMRGRRGGAAWHLDGPVPAAVVEVVSRPGVTLEAWEAAGPWVWTRHELTSAKQALDILGRHGGVLVAIAERLDDEAARAS